MTTAHFSGGRLDGEIRQAQGAPDRYHNPVGLGDDPPAGARNAPTVRTVELYRLVRSDGDEAWYEFETLTEGSG